MQKRSKILYVVIVISLLLIVFSCFASIYVRRPRNDKVDSKTDRKSIDDRPAFVIYMPKGFPNVAWKCIGPNSVWTTTANAPPVLVGDDDNCVGNTNNVSGQTKVPIDGG